MSAWEQLDKIISRGKRADKAGTLGALHEKRKETLSQFFTPDWLVNIIWNTMKSAIVPGKRYSLFDNSLGAASMFRFANPETFSLNGMDTDRELVHTVSDVLDSSGFDLDFRSSPMEDIVPGFYSAGMINPPFSIPLLSENMVSYPGITHYGKHGPDTSALSHEYALAQAIAHCDVVFAIVPASLTQKLNEFPIIRQRLYGVFRLPKDAFKEENVEVVCTDLLVFGRSRLPRGVSVFHGAVCRETDSVPLPYPLELRDIESLPKQKICVVGLDSVKASTSLPVTMNNRVVIKAFQRKLHLDFYCAITEVQVKNRLYERRLWSSHSHRFSKYSHYSGQFKLDLDVLVLQENPWKALDILLAIIKDAGGEPELDCAVKGRIKALIHEHKKMTVPFGRTVYRKGTPSFKATALKTGLLNRTERGAAVKINENVTAKRTPSGFLVKTRRGSFNCDHDLFFSMFRPEVDALDAGYWEEISPPIRDSFPQQISALERKAITLGLDNWLTWDFQMEDLCELAFKPKGGLCGWQMALGKTRLALALSLLLNGPSLIVVKSRLVGELVLELEKLGVNPSCYQVIDSVVRARDVHKINIISYEYLRAPIRGYGKEVSPARLLKTRISNLLCDEGGLLSNIFSQQTIACDLIKAKRRFIFDGTPYPNYPREMLALAVWLWGEAKSYQPYAIRKGHLSADLFTDGSGQPIGRKKFMDDFVCIEWATNEFLDSGKGAKREVPKIRSENIELFRSWISPLIKRRVQQEPAVQKHVSFRIPIFHAPIRVEWDFNHLQLYVNTCDLFAQWYRTYMAELGKTGKAANLTMILARLEACFKAVNVPAKHTIPGMVSTFTGYTSKEIKAADFAESLIRKGKRPILFMRSPFTAERIGQLMRERGRNFLIFTGKDSIKKRNKLLNSEVREGDADGMIATKGVTQDGLNLPELNSVLFYDRSWKAREEFQGIYRLIRAAQRFDVDVDYLHYEGSIDEYMGQLIDWKQLASEAGLDYGEQPDEQDFAHFDAFIERFLNSIPELKNLLRRKA